MRMLLLLLISFTLSAPALANMAHHAMLMDEHGMVMNANSDKLPQDCPKLSETVDITIHAGRQHALAFNGKMFAFDKQEWNVKPCAKINITFINDDQIRHQLMIHGLPGYLYPEGMFHLELYGAGELKASLIVPSQKKTYLVHCELPQHMEKGMKAQLKVDGGDGDLPSIPGISPAVKADSYHIDWQDTTRLLVLVCIALGMAIPFMIVQIVAGLKKGKLKDNATSDKPES